MNGCPKTSPHCGQIASLTGSFLAFLPNGFSMYWGNLAVYVYSYIYIIKKVDPSENQAPWLISLNTIARNVGLILACRTRQRLGHRVTLLVSISLFNVGLFLCYWAVDYSPWALNVCLGVISGLGNGLFHAAIMMYVINMSKSHVGFLTSAVTTGYSVGSALTNQGITLYVNPTNENADTNVGDVTFFSQRTILSHVPNVFLFLTIFSISCHLLGCFLIRECYSGDISNKECLFFEDIDIDVASNVSTPKQDVYQIKETLSSLSFCRLSEEDSDERQPFLKNCESLEDYVRCSESIKTVDNEEEGKEEKYLLKFPTCTQMHECTSDNSYTSEFKTREYRACHIDHEHQLNNLKIDNEIANKCVAEDTIRTHDNMDFERDQGPNLSGSNDTSTKGGHLKNDQNQLEYLNSENKTKTNENDEVLTDDPYQYSEGQIALTSDVYDDRTCTSDSWMLLYTKEFYVLLAMTFATETTSLVLFPYYKTFGLSWVKDDHLLTTLGTCLSLATTLTRLILGMVVDAFGLRLPTFSSLFILALISPVYVFTPAFSKWLYFGSTLLFGCANSAVFTCFYVGTLKLLGKTNFTTNYGILSTSNIVLNLLAPPIIDVIITSHNGWFLLFSTNGAIVTVALIIVVIIMPPR